MTFPVVGFGSRDWTRAVDDILAAALPSMLVHGACGLDADEPFLEEILNGSRIEVGDIGPDGRPRRAEMRGADREFHLAAKRLGIKTDPHPAAWSRLGKKAGFVRNAEMGPLVLAGIGCVVGKVGQCVGTKGHYLTNGSDHMATWLRKKGKPVVIYREDGGEPCRDIADARVTLLCLWRAGLYREDVARAGAAVREACGGGREALIAARAAVEALRVARPVLAPWLAPVEMAPQVS